MKRLGESVKNLLVGFVMTPSPKMINSLILAFFAEVGEHNFNLNQTYPNLFIYYCF